MRRATADPQPTNKFLERTSLLDCTPLSIIRGAGAIPRRSRRGYAPSPRNHSACVTIKGVPRIPTSMAWSLTRSRHASGGGQPALCNRTISQIKTSTHGNTLSAETGDTRHLHASTSDSVEPAATARGKNNTVRVTNGEDRSTGRLARPVVNPVRRGRTASGVLRRGDVRSKDEHRQT